ncbi:hypothetical protein I4F81_002736 [Pyropia yezoensis]|uniref:Uncharacterized protein n=1 Tax=Pyropia yezoensis TaxID=2788 RepID=A0ACC3BQH1_PYRYE|nr:hypothetical protein I4F81_002736 [Neopyropia yezoensis]
MDSLTENMKALIAEQVVSWRDTAARLGYRLEGVDLRAFSPGEDIPSAVERLRPVIQLHKGPPPAAAPPPAMPNIPRGPPPPPPRPLPALRPVAPHVTAAIGGGHRAIPPHGAGRPAAAAAATAAAQDVQYGGGGGGGGYASGVHGYGSGGGARPPRGGVYGGAFRQGGGVAAAAAASIPMERRYGAAAATPPGRPVDSREVALPAGRAAARGVSSGGGGGADGGPRGHLLAPLTTKPPAEYVPARRRAALPDGLDGGSGSGGGSGAGGAGASGGAGPPGGYAGEYGNDWVGSTRDPMPIGDDGRGTPWTKADVAALREGISKHGWRNWEAIRTEFGLSHRTPETINTFAYTARRRDKEGFFANAWREWAAGNGRSTEIPPIPRHRRGGKSGTGGRSTPDPSVDAWVAASAEADAVLAAVPASCRTAFWRFGS